MKWEATERRNQINEVLLFFLLLRFILGTKFENIVSELTVVDCAFILQLICFNLRPTYLWYLNVEWIFFTSICFSEFMELSTSLLLLAVWTISLGSNKGSWFYIAVCVIRLWCTACQWRSFYYTLLTSSRCVVQKKIFLIF